MEKTGLVYSIISATASIDSGRKGFATKGKAEEGRISYETGIANAMTAFKEAQTTADPQILILAEYTFISQELQFCDKSDKDSLSSLTKAAQSFDDAFFALRAVENPNYRITDETTPHSSKYRISGFPKDSFHIARMFPESLAEPCKNNCLATPHVGHTKRKRRTLPRRSLCVVVY